MALDVSVFEIIIMIYFVLGSYSLGYFLLRTGWPKIRILDKEYKIGWSIVFGVVFTLFSTGLGAATAMLSAETRMLFLFAAMASAVFVAIALVLTVRRKFFAPARISVAVPKQHFASGVIAEKSFQKALGDKELIFAKNLSPEKAGKIREALESV